MKLTWLALAASLALASFARAQEQAPAQAPAATPPAGSAPESSSEARHKISGPCRKEIQTLCGINAPMDQMRACVEANLHLNKFSDGCTGQLHAAGAGKPQS
jgi:hypothetical protein